LTRSELKFEIDNLKYQPGGQMEKKSSIIKPFGGVNVIKKVTLSPIYRFWTRKLRRILSMRVLSLSYQQERL
jgi:hypothetical protein